MISVSLLESHRNDLKNHYDRDFRIWQIRIDRNVCKNRRKTSNWRLLLNFLFQKFFSFVVFAEISMILWSEFFVNLLRCFEHRFSRERFNRIELLQNRCFQKHFMNTFCRRWKAWSFFDNCFFMKYCLCFNIKSRNQIYWRFL